MRELMLKVEYKMMYWLYDGLGWWINKRNYIKRVEEMRLKLVK
jgi:hypothetical protein